MITMQQRATAHRLMELTKTLELAPSLVITMPASITMTTEMDQKKAIWMQTQKRTAINRTISSLARPKAVLM